jgi:predicted acyl esterase
MSEPHDVPWRRPGRLAYALARVRSFIRPPVAVAAAPEDLVVERDLPVRMRDGIVLRANVYRPLGEGPFPVVLSVHPYGKDRVPRRRRRGGWSLNPQFRIMNQPAPFSISSLTGWEAPDPVWWTKHGYVVVNADSRGAGTSEGTGSLFSQQEAEDAHDVIEWAGTQAWSSGRVGMLGVSYLAISQYRVAALGPPHLHAICPWEGFTDAYRDFMTPGGVPERGFSVIWLALTRRVVRLRVDLGRLRRRHPLRDEFWASLTPDLGAITVPMLVCASFSDHNLHSQGSFRLFEDAGSADRYLFTHRAPKWATFYGVEARQTQLAFFDRHLRELDVSLPRVRLEVREARDRVAEVRTEHEWPLARTRWEDRFLDADRGIIGAAPPGAAATARFDLRRNASAFTLTFDEDCELTGPMSLRAWVELDGAVDADLFVGVEKWSQGRYSPFEGSYGYGRDRIADGRLRLSLRDLDPERSLPGRPSHRFDAARPPRRGEVMEVEIALGASATLFRRGERLRLLVAGRSLEPGNPLWGHFPARYERSGRGRCLIHTSREHPSALTIPVIER